MSHTAAFETQSPHATLKHNNTNKLIAFKYVKRMLIMLTCIRYDHGNPLRMGQ